MPIGLSFLLHHWRPVTLVAPSTTLVTTGPDRFSRNPMCMGFTLLYLGIGFLANSLWPLLLLPLVLVAMPFGVMVREEAYTERLFGEEYRSSRRRS